MVMVSRPISPLESVTVTVTRFAPVTIGIEALQPCSPTRPVEPPGVQSHPLSPVPKIPQQSTDWDAVPLPPAALFHLTVTPVSAPVCVPLRLQLMNCAALEAVPDKTTASANGGAVKASAVVGLCMMRVPLLAGGSSSPPPPQDTKTRTASPASKRLRSIRSPSPLSNYSPLDTQSPFRSIP